MLLIHKFNTFFLTVSSNKLQKRLECLFYTSGEKQRTQKEGPGGDAVTLRLANFTIWLGPSSMSPDPLGGEGPQDTIQFWSHVPSSTDPNPKSFVNSSS